jgi:hypothetical protein
MNKKLMYIFAIFIVAAITCISQPKKTTLRDKAMVNYAFDYLSSPGSLPFSHGAFRDSWSLNVAISPWRILSSW